MNGEVKSNPKDVQRTLPESSTASWAKVESKNSPKDASRKFKSKDCKLEMLFVIR